MCGRERGDHSPEVLLLCHFFRGAAFHIVILQRQVLSNYVANRNPYGARANTVTRHLKTRSSGTSFRDIAPKSPGTSHRQEKPLERVVLRAGTRCLNKGVNEERKQLIWITKKKEEQKRPKKK